MSHCNESTFVQDPISLKTYNLPATNRSILFIIIKDESQGMTRPTLPYLILINPNSLSLSFNAAPVTEIQMTEQRR